MSSRATRSGEPRVRLVRGGRLLRRGRRRLHVLKSPGGLVPINTSAAAILALCDGSLGRSEIVAQLCREHFGAICPRVVNEFLDAAFQSEWIVSALPGAGARRRCRP